MLLTKNVEWIKIKRIMIVINVVVVVVMMCVKAWLNTSKVSETTKMALGVYNNWIGTYLSDIFVLVFSVLLVYHYFV